jgi:hypothetical protein
MSNAARWKTGDGDPVSDPPPHILEALNAVMLDVTAIGKDGRNQQQNYPFRSYDGTINIVGPALRTHGVIPSFEVTEVTRREFRYSDSGSLMTETLVRLNYTFTSMVDGSTHTIRGVPGESADRGDKSATKAVTVAIRVAILQGLAIPLQTPDPDEQIHEKATRKAPRSSQKPQDVPPVSAPVSSSPRRSRPNREADPGEPTVSPPDTVSGIPADSLPPTHPDRTCPACDKRYGDHTLRKDPKLNDYVHRKCENAR